ncbi:hypothetical protein E2986_09012 [Frieseomelitta varia]|uniref:Small ribosomal subunit protein eS31 domain-containing protein n=1 Tax=Frieseomelitta varia TaxID=561572 RepID=A0A833S699_9HYME|nr:hypothetical protein E2986_09012 [Frieseomelitta varia]
MTLFLLQHNTLCLPFSNSFLYDHRTSEILTLTVVILQYLCDALKFNTWHVVDENGKIHRLRRECPMEQCGAGVFMAAMEDRHYCGKCGYTLVFNKPEDK